MSKPVTQPVSFSEMKPAKTERIMKTKTVLNSVARRLKAMAIVCGVCLIALAAPPNANAQTPAASIRVETGVIKLAESGIEYFSQGQGQAIVLLPGGSLTVGYLDGLSQALAKAGYRVVRINLRGAGKSTGSATDVTLHTLAADVAGVIEALKIQPVNLGGHAFGNRVARMLAADRPDLVRSVILVAAGGKVNPAPPAEQALGIIFNPKSADPEVLGAMSFMVGDPKDGPAVWKVLKPSRAPAAAGIQAAAAKSTPLEDWWAPKGTSKYLVLQGTNDQAAPVENGELLKKELGERVTLVPFPGAGHLMVIEQPKKAADAIVAFLK
jgi:pimeloyl-ACP methyl ester carboxylesterase